MNTDEEKYVAALLHQLYIVESERDRLEEDNKSLKRSVQEYYDKLQGTDGLLTEVTAERDRYRKALEDVTQYPTCGLTAVDDVHAIARAALEWEKDTGGVTREEIENFMAIWFRRGEDWHQVAARLTEVFEMRRRG